MASHLGNVSQSAAGMAASEVTSGNFSFGNISEGNSQISNSHMLQHSNAASYKANSFQMMDGRSEITTMSDGSQIANVATSNIPTSINLAQARSNQMSQMASESYQSGLNLTEASSSSLSSASRSMVSLSDTLSKLESSGDAANLGISSEQSQAIHHGKQLVKDFVKQTGIEESKAAQLLGSVSVGNSKGLGLISGSVGMSGDMSAKEQELYNKAQRFAEENNYQDALRNASQASKQLSHSVSDESARRLAEDVSGSYEQGISQRSEAAKSFSQSEQYQRQSMETLSNSASINFNANQQFVEWVAEQPADNTGGGTIGMREATRIVSTNPAIAQGHAERFLASQGLNPGSSVASSAASIRGGYDKEQSHQVHAVTRQSMDDVRANASSMGSSTHGGATRERVEGQLNHGHGEMQQGVSGIQNHGSYLKSTVFQEQDKGVIRRVGARGIKEAAALIPGYGEAQQK
jgi:conjugal transfer mating pair stabilization protein TraG